MSYHKTVTEFTPVNTGRISAEIADQIKAAIREGRLGAGDQLPAERDLTKQLGVSRVSVRDALRMLEAQGLIEVRVGARGGAFVTTPAPSLVSEGFADLLRMSDVSPADVTEMRLIFELAMLPLAVERATEDDLAALAAICAASEAEGYDVARSAEFHTRLAACTHNDALALFAESFHQPLLRSLQVAKRVAPEMGGAGTREHLELIDAMRDRDVARAVTILSAHLGRTAERLDSAHGPG
jgi:DNA-binding FadR family transcriptional regulator